LSVPQRVRGVKILKAVSSPLRLQILNLLFDKGPLSYTELMSQLKMNPGRDAGRFAYHLKFLLRADLIEAVVETRKYCLTDLGKMVIDVADRIDKKAFKPKSILVRASRSAIEEFDANRIASSLIKEAKMPADLAQKVAKEAEKQLLKSKTKYLTAPLVREVVNAILIDKGLEEYRHKLTRLGVPVHDVTSLIESATTAQQKPGSVQLAAGETVLKEYMLLNILPRDIADAHLSGSLHINHLSSWILQPTEIMHDLRFFLHNGLNTEKISATWPAFPPPQNLESALALTLNVFLHSAKEVDRAQTLDYFNVFLAPYVQGAEPLKIKESLRLFIMNLSQHADATVGLELTVPDFMAEKTWCTPSGKEAGKYKDLTEQTQLLASLLLDVFAEETANKPLLHPKLVLKLRTETFTDERARALLLRAHRYASERGGVYFANALEKSRGQTVFSCSGCRLNADLDGDWETDTLRTGCLGVVTVNAPRAAYESGLDTARFHEILKERVEMANRALEMKHRALKQHGERLLPFIMQNSNGDQYFRLENCVRTISLAGLKEAAEAFSAKGIGNEKTAGFAQDTVESMMTFVQKIGRRRGKRLQLAILPGFEASERLAQLDIERYGVAKTRFSGTRDKPFYSTVNVLKMENSRTPVQPVTTTGKSAATLTGGSLTVVELGEAQIGPDELLNVTKELAENGKTEFFTYNRKITHCVNCKKSWFGILHKCPSCGAVSTLTFFDPLAEA
jgi:ribonucleoside-triphosphate reductase